MLRRLFKGRNRLDHPDAEVRRAAVGELTPDAAAGLGDTLARLLRDDPDLEVRLACVDLVTDPAVLTPLLDDRRLGEAVARRVLELSPAAAAGHPRLLGAGLKALSPAEAAERLRDIDDPEALIDLALKSRGPLRDTVLDQPALRRPAALAALEKRSRGRDKALNRHARRLLDRRKTLHQEAGAAEQRARELAEALARQAPTGSDRAWRERQHELHARLETTLDHHDALRRELTGYEESGPDLTGWRVAAADLPSLDEEIPPPADADGETEARAPAALPDAFEPLLEPLKQIDEALAQGRLPAELARDWQALSERWLSAAAEQSPDTAQAEAFAAVTDRFEALAAALERLETSDLPDPPAEALAPADTAEPGARAAYWQAVAERRRLANRLEQLERRVQWPDWARPDLRLNQLRDALTELRQDLDQAGEVLAAELAALESQLDELGQAIDAGSLSTAQTLLQRLRTRHDSLPDGAGRNLGRALGRQAARLAELKDWQTFVTTPKREALVESMAALADDPLAAPDQARRIKALRREWRDLGPITRADDGQLADRFNRAAEAAFEPCRAYFAEQAEQRQANLDARVAVCDQLERYLAETDWSRADMQAAEHIMRAAREEWRAHHPVDRDQGRAVEERFEALQDRLHQAVKSEWDRNLAAKEALVGEADRLAEADLPVPEKVARAKTLQQRWREVGSTPRRPDQRLWRDFRAACDRIFAARESARAEAETAREQAKAERQAAEAALVEVERAVVAVLDEFEASLAGTEPDAADEAALRRFQERCGDIERLPVHRHPALNDRRDALIARYRALLAERGRADRRREIEGIARWDEAVTAREQGAHDGPEIPAPAGLADEVIRTRRAGAEPPAGEDALRRLVVQAEVAAGLDSSAADEALRLEIQVERLKAGLSGAGAAPAHDPQALLDAWCRLGPKHGDVAALRQRFFAALGRSL